MSRPGDVHVRLSADQRRGLRQAAYDLGLSLSDTIRQAVNYWLESRADRLPMQGAPASLRPLPTGGDRLDRLAQDVRDVYEVALAALVSSEHSLAMLTDRPGGRDAWLRLVEDAATGAQQRLARLRDALAAEDTVA